MCTSLATRDATLDRSIPVAAMISISRPLEARPDRERDRLLFVTDAQSGKRYEVDRFPEVALVFINPTEKAYLSISGRAWIADTSELRADAWRERDQVWWSGGPNDPDVCVLVAEPAVAELWDGPSSAAVAAYEFAKARATGREPNLGENRKTTSKCRTELTHAQSPAPNTLLPVACPGRYRFSGKTKPPCWE
jgi:general stress protein 26